MQRTIEFICDLTKGYLKSHKGVYQLINTVNNHSYVGSTDRNFRERFLEHCATYHKYKNGGKLVHPILGAAYDKYGINSFEIKILELLDDSTSEEILAREGYYIRTLHPEYNICQEPEVGGAPNKGKKLTEEGKQHIAEKSAQYKHSDEALALVTANNKANACKIKLYNGNELALEFNSGVELCSHFKLKSACAAMKCAKENRKGHGYIIKKENSQMKQIVVHFDDHDETFDSFNKCDKALNMGRGYTSTMFTRNIDKLLDKYSYEVL